MLHRRYVGRASGLPYEQWREEFGRRWLSADIEPLEGDYFANEFHATQHSFLGLCAMRGTPVYMRRRDDIAASALEFFYLIVASGARLQIHQRGRSGDLQVGQMSLMSAGEPAGVRQITQGSRWSIRLPRRALDVVCPEFDDEVARPLTASRDLTKLLLHQVET